MNTQKSKRIVCKLHTIHTEDIITVKLERKKGGYAILTKKNRKWYIVILRFRKKKWSKKITKMTVFKEPFKYHEGDLINRRFDFLSRRVFLKHEEVDYFDCADTGYIPEEYFIDTSSK